MLCSETHYEKGTQFFNIDISSYFSYLHILQCKLRLFTINITLAKEVHLMYCVVDRVLQIMKVI
jgi:hypothetical protein